MIAFFEKIITVTDLSSFTLFEHAIIFTGGSMLVLGIMPILIFGFVVDPDGFVGDIINYIDRIKGEFNEDE